MFSCCRCRVALILRKKGRRNHKMLEIHCSQFSNVSLAFRIHIVWANPIVFTKQYNKTWLFLRDWKLYPFVHITAFKNWYINVVWCILLSSKLYFEHIFLKSFENKCSSIFFLVHSCFVTGKIIFHYLMNPLSSNDKKKRAYRVILNESWERRMTSMKVHVYNLPHTNLVKMTNYQVVNIGWTLLITEIVFF